MQARSEPVSMLVPNASSEFRALIGDQDAEDTSDLSECSAQSDEEIEQEIRVVISNVVSETSESEKESFDLEAITLNNSDIRKDLQVVDNSKKPDIIFENGKHTLNEEQKIGSSVITNKESLNSGKTSEKENIIKRADESEKISRTISCQKEQDKKEKKDENKKKGTDEKEDKIPLRVEALLDSSDSRVSESIQKTSPGVSEKIEKTKSVDENLKVNSKRNLAISENSLTEERKETNNTLNGSEVENYKEKIPEEDISKSKLLMTNGHYKVDGN